MNTIYKDSYFITGLSSLSIMTIFALIGICSKCFCPYSIHFEWANLSPNPTFWFGTDELGRDLFSRTAQGLAISLCLGLIGGILDLIIGVGFGTICAMFKGKIDRFMMFLCDVLSAIPFLLLVLLFRVIFQTGFSAILLTLICIGWIQTARITRASIIKMQNREYILVSQSLGASKRYIFSKHIVPNISSCILPTVIANIPKIIFTEAFLSFIGLGIQPPFVSLGLLISNGITTIGVYPSRFIIPSILFMLALLSFQFIGFAYSRNNNPAKNIRI